MKSPRRVVRRVLAVFGAVAVGTLAAVAIPSAAEAHTVSITGTAGCADGKAIVDWTVTTTNVPTGYHGTILQQGFAFTPANSTLEKTIAANVTVVGNGTIKGRQTVTDSHATTATLALTIRWTEDGHEAPKTSPTVTLRTDCTPHTHASAATQCDDSVDVTVTNDSGATASADFHVTAAGGFSASATVAPGGAAEPIRVPAEKATGIAVTANGQPVALTAPTPASGCDTPTTPPAAAPELPTTGSSLTLPITIGAVFVAAGAVLMFMYRRRRSVQ